MSYESVELNDSSLQASAASGDVLPVVQDTCMAGSNLDEVYEAVLKVVILEYINEPRFRKKFKKVEEVEESEPLLRDILRDKSSLKPKDTERKRATWFRLNSDLGSGEASTLKKIRPILENRLSSIAIGNYKLKDDLLRRSLLKLYNDLFLDPKMSNMLDYMARFEELIMLFAKAASGEILKLDIEYTQKALYQQVSHFIDLLIQLLDVGGLSTPEFVSKLKSYTDSFKPGEGDGAPRARISNLVGVNKTRTKVVEVTVKPAFKISEIAHSGYIKELFGVDDRKLNEDLLRIKNEVKNDIYQDELKLVRDKVANGTAGFTTEDFTSKDLYQQWKESELRMIDELVNKLEESKAGHNVSADGISFSKVIPINARDFYLQLLCSILNHEKPCVTEPISAHGQFLISKCAKYWRLELFSTRASLFYAASNLTLLKGSELDHERAEYLIQVAQSSGSQGIESEHDNSKWNSIDRHQWLTNLNKTFSQCMISLQELIPQLYSPTKPKFSPVLNIYHNYVLGDPLMQHYNLINTDIHRKWVKKLRGTLFKTNEECYISLLQKIPKERTVSMYQIQEIAECILEQIKSTQKRYPKPLLKGLNIAHECAAVLIGAFGNDLARMLPRAEQNAISTGNDLDAIDSINIYKSLQELRKVYTQVRDDEFPFNLEKFFIKYFFQLCEETSKKILSVIDTSRKKDIWEPVGEGVYYSASVVDIFKMMNESLSIFDKLGWGDEYQIAKIKTFLLKAFSDGLCQYASKVVMLIEEDLFQNFSSSPEDSGFDSPLMQQTTAERVKNTWLFNEMRNALRPATDEPPEAFEFKRRTCICLNNLSEMMAKISELEETIDAEHISQVVRRFEATHSIKQNGLLNMHKKREVTNQLYTIRVIKAENILPFTSDGFSNSAATLVDTSIRKEIAKTKVIRKTVNPVWDEVFELEIPSVEVRVISATIWHHSSKMSPLSSYKVCGKCSILLDPSRFNNDGYPEEVILDLDTQGRLYLQISLENERVDAMFSVGRAYRALSRACDRGIGLMVSKFSAFVSFSLSRNTLKSVCINSSASGIGSIGGGIAGGISDAERKNIVYDAISPLFDYLNSNLAIMATELNRSLLHKVMLQAWNTILNAADTLLLPNLSSARSMKKAVSSKSMTLWENAMNIAKGENGADSYYSYYYSGSSSSSGTLTSNGGTGSGAIAGLIGGPAAGGQSDGQGSGGLLASGQAAEANNYNNNIVGFGMTLTQREVDIVFEWLRALCVDFFHNSGEGPPLQALKNQHYQNLLLVPVFYDKSVEELESEVERLMPLYEQYLDHRNCFEFSRHSNFNNHRTSRGPPLPRRDSVWAHSSKTKRAQAAAAVRQLENDPLEVSAVTQDIILRILLAKGQSKYVYDTLNHRSKLAKAIATKKLVQAAVRGPKPH
ncbi:uncharacterized protein Ecym_2462 [Eremothecium cymbalariae DBVPG|uniref:C2 domain-containing protein n=1 Tax=Eremothecium cymbalariae (strain CBS 270.75 / DBVPG 7215 / KCTC 17166 / NRRL Y-17582) TaxID=931890 RepID=G8JPT0_ERECY|nr:Hypothetical protein Ecym_2462 [Eremothecium cymbalariae DBVPG\